MKQARIKILSGKYEGKIGLMDPAGYVTFVDISDKIHKNDISDWEFFDFK